MRLTLSTLLAILLILAPRVYAMSIAPKDPPKPPPSSVETGVKTSTIILSCPTNIADASAMCNALEAALQSHAPGHEILRSNRAPDIGELAIMLHITRADKYAVEGYLEWRRNSGATQSGPPVTLGVTDAPLTIAMFGQFTSGLIKVSKLPIH